MVRRTQLDPRGQDWRCGRLWHIHPNVILGWTRLPVTTRSGQAPTPARRLLWSNSIPCSTPKNGWVLVSLRKVSIERCSAATKPWGKWMRYQYAHFDFSAVRDAGIYTMDCPAQTGALSDRERGLRRHLAPLARYLSSRADGSRQGAQGLWQPPGDIHLDDPRQAPVNYTHFDGYKQGPTTNSPFSPGQPIPFRWRR